ncbi:hypothetical protein KAR91_50695 [Candidatus Pacearchaeota archaeon]|nr:hypothetical protein [Candidatus Pacearchaeota archaeon]
MMSTCQVDEGYDIMAVEIDWPAESREDGLCLHCELAKRQRHSWFCRIECEAEYVRLNRKEKTI